MRTLEAPQYLDSKPNPNKPHHNPTFQSLSPLVYNKHFLLVLICPHSPYIYTHTLVLLLQSILCAHYLQIHTHTSTSSRSDRLLIIIMAGVWVFENNGVIRLENPQSEGSSSSSVGRRSVLVYLPTGEVVRSYSSLERILCGLGWERYYGGDADLYQFHKHSSIDLISLPRDFSKFNSVYMYDIVVKNPELFRVRDV